MSCCIMPLDIFRYYRNMTPPDVITFDMVRQSLFAAVICDVLDAAGHPHQSPRVAIPPMTGSGILVGRCRTTLWTDMAHSDPKPYELELAAVDHCTPDDVLIAAAGGSNRSGIWGELLTTAARKRGCVGAIVDGMIRDVAKIRAMNFPVFARGTCIYDSKDRQRVIDLDVPVEIDGVRFSPGDLVVADDDGIVVVPRVIEHDVIRKAWIKVHAENQVRDAIQAGMKATDAYRQFGVL
jgi:4-hydroxy-4-methyl-2-oxoglutarate aldolase